MKQTKKIPERMCVACRQMKPKNQLVRLVKPVESQCAVVDVTGKMNGRGAYLCRCRQCIDKARKNKGFAKAHGFSVTDELYAELEKLIEQ